ncbi:hypothetical protein DHX103_02445 [Planococcus sp. X10-3]|uniref:anti-sigma-I factor RsgI family protein n=1 Tax=Planococcus sp. X10-3 TaxID=3061240 RepID=UPI003BB1B5FD
MRMQKGLCVELNDKSSIFIGPNGEFVHGTPARETAVGEECYFYPKQELAARKRQPIKPSWVSFAAAFAVAILFLSALLPKQEAYAYVQVQVNPGIELGIDENYEVVSIRELNEDGHELIAELEEWENHSLDQVLDKIINLSMTDTTDEIIITTIADEKDTVADKTIENAVMAISEKVLAGDVAVRLKDASRAQWRNSIKEKVPAGQLVTDSKSLSNEQEEELDKEPVKIKEEQKDKEPKSNDKARDKDQKAPAAKEKATPPGQEKRQETPAAEKGEVKPPGQEKRDEVPGQNEKNGDAVFQKSQTKPGTETAPGQQKKNKDNDEVKGSEVVPPAKQKGLKDKPQPADSTPAGENKPEGNPSQGNANDSGEATNNNGIHEKSDKEKDE